MEIDSPPSPRTIRQSTKLELKEHLDDLKHATEQTIILKELIRRGKEKIMKKQKKVEDMERDLVEYEQLLQDSIVCAKLTRAQLH